MAAKIGFAIAVVAGKPLGATQRPGAYKTEEAKKAVRHLAGVINEANRIISFENDVLRRADAMGGGGGGSSDSIGDAKSQWPRLECSRVGRKASSSTLVMSKRTLNEPWVDSSNSGMCKWKRRCTER